MSALAARPDPAGQDPTEAASRLFADHSERLCHVEHTDHKRFLTEDSASLFDEIRTLYALNAGDTYRYSVSTAGAGLPLSTHPPITIGSPRGPGTESR